MIDTLFFWQDGVITTPLAEVVLEQVRFLGAGELDVRTRLAVRDWVQGLQLGRVSGESFCQKLQVLVPALACYSDLPSRFLSAVALSPGMADLLAEARTEYECWLVSSYPSDWLQALDQRLGLSIMFSPARVQVFPQAGLGKCLPDVFVWAIQKAQKRMESCLWVAGEAAMTTSAVRVGLNAIVFADSRRLRRELVLRGMLPTR